MSTSEVGQEDGQLLKGWRICATTIAIGMMSILLVSTHHVHAVGLPGYLRLQSLEALLPWFRTRATY